MSKFVNLEKIIFMRPKTWVTTLLALAVFSAGLTAAPAGGPVARARAGRGRLLAVHPTAAAPGTGAGADNKGRM